jgi:VCBS repeat-containing protein
VTISDPDTVDITITISLDDPDKGVLINLGNFIQSPNGSYTFTGSPEDATTDIRTLTFDPAQDRVPIGDTETTAFTISADDGVADPVTDDITTVIVTVVEKLIIYLPVILH